jgi:hypothetical protein
MSREYVYKDLPGDGAAPQIRVLRLQPDPDFAAPLRLTLNTVLLIEHSAIPYEALSYVWGHAASRCNVLIDGSILPITDSLNLALKYLRYASKERTLWVDAVCINQKNIREKSSQVSMMRNVYQNAAKVIVWLGGPDPQIINALTFLSKLTKEEYPYISAGELSSFPHDDVKHFFESPWWTRVWTMQELYMARRELTFECGHTHLSETPIDKIQKALELVQIPLRFRLHHFLGACLWPYPQEWQWIIRASCGRRATVPHDHVYGILGMLDRIPDNLSCPDYSLPVSEVYQAATIHLL